MCSFKLQVLGFLCVQDDKGRFFKPSWLLWLSSVLSLTGQSNPWCNLNCIWLFLIFLAGRELLLNVFPTNFWPCQKIKNKRKNKILGQSFPRCDHLMCSAAPAPHMAMMVRQMSESSSASRQQLCPYPTLLLNNWHPSISSLTPIWISFSG